MSTPLDTRVQAAPSQDTPLLDVKDLVVEYPSKGLRG